jgi:hypothetical protein
MFHLHDKTRRELAIVGFFVLCLLPTCAVAGWCLWRNMPWETQLAAERLQQQLGWNVKLERLKHPRPGTEIYENMELLNPETGQSLFTCRSIEVNTKLIADPQGQEKPTLALSFDHPEIHSAAFEEIGRLVERVVQDQVAPSINCEISTVEMKLRNGNTVQAFADVKAGVAHSENFVQAALLFHLPSAKEAAPLVFRLSRDRTVSPPRSSFELVTSENEMTWEKVVSEIPEFAKLGLKLDNKIKNDGDGLWHLYLTSSVGR